MTNKQEQQPKEIKGDGRSFLTIAIKDAPFRVYSFHPDGRDREPTAGEDKTFIIYQPSRGFDDDVYTVYWTDTGWKWKVAGYGPLSGSNNELDGNSANILLEYFDLSDHREKFPLSKLQSLSPEDLFKDSNKRSP